MGNINHMVVLEVMLKEFIGMVLQQDLPIKQMHSELINSKLVDKEPAMVGNNLAVTGLWIVTSEEIQNGLGIIIHTPLPLLVVSNMVVGNPVLHTLAVIIIHLMILEIKHDLGK